MDRILIVDDEFLIRYTLEEGLKDRGYDAYSCLLYTSDAADD